MEERLLTIVREVATRLKEFELPVVMITENVRLSLKIKFTRLILEQLSENLLNEDPTILNRSLTGKIFNLSKDDSTT